VRYNELTRRYFESGIGAGELTGPAVGRGAAGSRAAGTWVQFDIAIDADVANATACPENRIGAARFLAFACPHTIAVAAWLVERSVGAPCVAVLPETVHELVARFEMPVEKLGRLLIVEDAWLAAARAASACVCQG
jgi:NifU-like protein involved in Fe-S cluster formation